MDMIHMLDHARTVGDAAFEALLVERGRASYPADRDCPTACEPSGEDFISPCLVEADLMRRVLPTAELAGWLARFLPDPTDPRIGHLIGLAFQRASAYAGIASALPVTDARRELFARLADADVRDGLRPMFDSGYGGEHWLASFAIYAMTSVGVE